MVKVLFGEDFGERTILDIDSYFNNVYENDWLEDENVKQIVKDIDGSELNGLNVISPVLGSISVRDISGGAKALICLLKEDNPEGFIDLVVLGENCEKWLAYVFENKDVQVCMTGYHLFFDDYNVSGVCLNDNTEIKNSNDWRDKLFEYGE
ncbi:MAG: DUF4869 domain-containing protein [Lachnospiraceae bacterium]|nr:DUF4869 domain-containing protein [Lachnospiraceae bacterium]